jgi:hypothetical protein
VGYSIPESHCKFPCSLRKEEKCRKPELELTGLVTFYVLAAQLIGHACWFLVWDAAAVLRAQATFRLSSGVISM